MAKIYGNSEKESNNVEKDFVNEVLSDLSSIFGLVSITGNVILQLVVALNGKLDVRTQLYKLSECARRLEIIKLDGGRLTEDVILEVAELFELCDDYKTLLLATLIEE